MNRQTLIVIIVVVVFGGAGLWFFYFQSSASTELGANISFSSSNPDVQRIEQELADLRRLKDLQIDTSILKNPFLQSLEAPRISPPSFQNNGTTTPGRPNPFLPF